MVTISDLKCDGVGAPIQVRILHKWKHDVCRYETWYLAVDRFGAIKDQRLYKTRWPVLILLILMDDSGNEIAINLWKECITVPTKFDRSLLIPLPAITVVVVTNLKPSVSAGMLRHGSSHATHIYVNPQIQETTSLINLFSGPMRPQSAPSGIPTTLKDIKLKMRSELLITCPTCRDPIFKRGPHWFCSAHATIEKSSLTKEIMEKVSCRPKYANYLQMKAVLATSIHDGAKAIQTIYSLKRETESIIEKMKIEMKKIPEDDQPYMD
ncbi:unnamed protein product [Lactuca saligna]|uniref:Replication factor A C-terminal domain-containing protein n=1 Tax=Lactuca saligna TaxID=75948 RepID=A0AA35Y9D7_LACSI|nr:unnamed protein product [Lactuca saligna]